VISDVVPTMFHKDIRNDVAAAAGLSPSHVTFGYVDTYVGDPSQVYGVHVNIFSGNGP
jgi:hypothetical protein